MKKSRPPIVWLGLIILPLLAFFAITVFVTLNTMYSFAFIVTLYEIAQRRAASGEAAVAVFGAAVSDGVAVAFLTNGVAAAAVFGLWYFLLCRPGAEAEGDGSKRCAPMVAWSIVSGLVLCTFATEMITVAEFFAPKVIAEFAEMMERTFDGSWLPILAAVLIAPFSEEFLCRGVTQHYL
ncbi:MAG: hypothetical protein LBI54_08660, partial [Lachnospiraceae bacterium]|nr:hypothetical protein [Lachnospiraceae bacterium]